MRTAHFSVISLIAALLAFTGRAEAWNPEQERDDDKTLSPYFFIEGDNPGQEAFPLRSTEVKATVNGVIADVVVTQTYVNGGQKPINARYVFPASTRASVHGLKMTIGDRVVAAKIKEREKARATFERAKQQGKSASLLEQQRPNVFTMSVANIMPGDKVLIELHYTELLTPTEGEYEFVYPTVVGPRYSNQPEATAPPTDRWIKSPYLKEGDVPPTSFSVDLRLSTGIPLGEVTSPSHEIQVTWKDEALADIALADPGYYAGDRDFILRYRLAGKAIQSGLLLYEGKKENFFLLLVQPPERVETQQILPREYVFILDVSGSMHGFPLDTAKTVIRKLIGGLRTSDRFNVVLFAGASELMAPRSVAANEKNIKRALRLIDDQSGGGGTELSSALKRTLGLPRSEGMTRTVVVVTDGYIGAEKEAFTLVSENLSTTNLFAFGIGSSVNRYLIEGLAKTGLGEPFVVTRPEEAGEAANRFSTYVRSPVLTKVRVRYQGFDAYGVEPSAQPDLFALRPLMVTGKWRGKATGEIEVSGMTPSGVYSRTFELDEAKPQPSNKALRYLWARTRVAALADYSDAGVSEKNEEQITRLGLTYGLLTPYTSFVAVLEKRRNKQGPARDVEQPLPLPMGVSDLAVGDFGAAPEPETLPLLLAVAVMLLILSWRRRVCQPSRG